MPSISGFVYDASSAAAVGRTVRAYRRDTGALLGSATTSAGPAATNDPHYALTSLALRFNGTDGSTTVTDESVSPKTVTVNGNAQIDTAQSAFGGSSLLLDGTGDFLSVPNSSAFDFGSGNVTMGFWARPSGVVAVENIAGKRSGTNFGPFSILMDAGRLRVRLSTSGSAWNVDVTGSIVLSTSAFTFCEWCRDGNTIRLFVGGVPDGTAAITGSVVTNSEPAYIGALSTGASGFAGWLDDFVITKGVARRTTNYSGSLPTQYIPAATVLAAGGYSIDTGSYSGECNVIALDDSGGDVENDLVLRTTPV